MSKQEKKMTREEMIDILKTKKDVVVDFTKKNGEDRAMYCTLDFKNIPEENHPNSDTDKPINEDIIKVWDFERKEWRSFRVDSVNGIGYDE